jgi:CRISPR-associated protein Csd2
MSSLENKIDFAVIFSAKNANPNGDPLNGNRPRQNNDGYGEVSDVCIKRKLRNRLQAMRENIFVQSDESRKENDNHRSLNARYEATIKNNNLNDKGLEVKTKFACKEWFDVRAFGQVFAFKEKQGSKKKGKQEQAEEEQDTEGSSGSVSIGVRGPVTIQSAFSIEPITTESLQITKSVNLETNEKQPEKKGSDTMGMKHRVSKAVYVTYGAMNTQLASKTGFSNEDSDKIKDALITLFHDDASSARPEGSMEVLKVIWWKHNSPNGQYSSAKVHNSLKELLEEKKDGSYDSAKLKNALKGLEPKEFDGE